MTVDTGSIVSNVKAFVDLGISYIPLGLTIVAIPAALVVGIKFSNWIANYLHKAFD